MEETEAKFYVRDLKRIESRLRQWEARLIQPRLLERNIRFDLPDNRLRSEGRVLRLRQDTAARLTYKGKSANHQGVLKRTEIEFVAEDFEKARQFLEALGYRRLFYYEKYRTTYGLTQPSEVFEASEGSVHVMLDELPYGTFVEIEGETVESIQAAAEKLALKWECAIPTSYHVLFDRLCRKYPALDAADLSFAALQGMTITAEDLSVCPSDD
ncbi:MAG: class IV adenylate cyclase [Chloroflexota bacterium]|nr:class IV adenylate cyclase [Chloroflexota bacterium]MBI5703625.1 class IV adenylate cyclase [Chloroflexota bacterium]